MTLEQLRAARYELVENAPSVPDPAEVLWGAQMLTKHGQQITPAAVSARIGASEDATALALSALKDAGQLKEASGIKKS